MQRAVATTIATTTPTKGNVVSLAAKSLLLKDAAAVQNAVASASVASSPTPIIANAPISTLGGVDFAAAGLKTKQYNLILSLIDNTQSKFPVAVSSPSSLSSKTLESEGKFLNRPTTTGGKLYDKFFIYIPSAEIFSRIPEQKMKKICEQRFGEMGDVD